MPIAMNMIVLESKKEVGGLYKRIKLHQTLLTFKSSEVIEKTKNWNFNDILQNSHFSSSPVTS